MFPAYGIGNRPSDTEFRPYVTGGLGGVLNLIVVTNIETGKLELRWYMGNPLDAWALQVAAIEWDLEVAAVTWVVTEPEVIPMPDVEPIWSILVDGILWSVWEPSLSWVTDLQDGWTMELQEDHWGTPSTSWEFGMVTS